MAFGFLVLTGHKVEVQLTSGFVYEGIFHGPQFNHRDPSRGHGVILRHARVIHDPTARLDKDALAERPIETKTFKASELVQLVAKDVRMNPEDLSRKDEFKRNAGEYGRALQRWWTPGMDEDDGLMVPLEAEGATAAGWNQFEANERIFGVYSTYDEQLYTTVLDKQRCGISETLAAQLAREIEQDHTGPRMGPGAHHMLTARGLDLAVAVPSPTNPQLAMVRGEFAAWRAKQRGGQVRAEFAAWRAEQGGGQVQNGPPGPLEPIPPAARLTAVTPRTPQQSTQPRTPFQPSPALPRLTAWAQGLLDSICKWPKRLRPAQHRAAVENCLKHMRDGELRDDWIEPEEVKAGCSVAHGGFADVMQATWRGQDVALKQFRPFSRADGRTLVQSFVKEVCLLSQLSNRSIVHLHGFTADVKHGWLGLVLEWAGESLAAVMADERAGSQAASPETRLHWAAGVAEGLLYLHSQRPRIVHRDLTSLNVMVSHEGRAKLIDFGISQALQQTYLTVNHACNHAWMAPEVLEGHQKVKGLQVLSTCDEKCDVYSFGVLLAALATGQEPWEGMSGFALAAEFATGARLGAPELSQMWLQQLIQQCLREEPATRPDMEQVLRVLHDNQADGIICLRGPWPLSRP